MMIDTQGTIFSNLKPIGRPHLGKYLGAIKEVSFLLNQNPFFSTFLMISDLSAALEVKNPTELSENAIDAVCYWIASGINPINKNVAVFSQSGIKAHIELFWILSSFACNMIPKEGNILDSNNKIMSACCPLLYNSQKIVTGKNKINKVKLGVDVANKFNTTYGSRILAEPTAHLSPTEASIMSLSNPGDIMHINSNPDSYIDIMDEDSDISRKIKNVELDQISSVYFDAQNRPALSNLINIMCEISGASILNITSEYGSKGHYFFKNGLIEILIEYISPIRDTIRRLKKDRQYLINIIKSGNCKAEFITTSMMEKIKTSIGIEYI